MSVVHAAAPLVPRRVGKWLFFAVLAALAVTAIQADEGFLFNRADPEWAHIARFQWWLLPHGLAGATALLIGPFQFSDSLRRTRPALHRQMGRIYVGAICIAALLSIYITLVFEPRPFQVEIWAQGGGWFLCAILALVFAMKRNIVLHRQWVARSYGFTFIFIAARVPDAFHVHWKDAVDFVTYLWSLTFLAAIVPDLLLQWPALLSGRARARS